MGEILMSCPHCEVDMSVDETLIGQRLACPSCGEEFDALVDGEEMVEEAEAVPRTKKTSVLAVVSLILALMCFGLPAVICGHIARAKIKNSNGMLTGGGMALAALLMSYLSMALSLIMTVSIGIPAFTKTRSLGRQVVCSANINMIKVAKEQWIAQNNKAASDQIDIAQINKNLPNRTTPTCPEGGSYSYGKTGVDPTCSVHVGGPMFQIEMTPTPTQ